MKWFVITLLFSQLALARTPELLKCLGKEEKNYHLKKDLGPSYDLNQRLIAEILQVPNTIVTPTALKSICSAKEGASWKLLQLSLTQGKTIFHIPSQITGMQRKMAEEMIGDYIKASKEILLNLITQIQSIAATPDCLTTEFPALVPFFTDLKYLQDEVDMEKLFQGRDEKIFADLRSYPKALKKCQTRVRKKPKSGSTAAPKKS